jgi:hypothetical protein
MRYQIRAFGILMFLFTTLGFAGEENDFKTCYGYFSSGVESNAATDELLVLIDQTTNLDLNLKSMVNKKIRAWMLPGRKLNVITFSTYEDDDYTKRLVSGQLDSLLTSDQEYKLPKSEIRLFNSCIRKQELFATKLLNEALESALNGADVKIKNSEIIGNLYRISESLIKSSPVKNKYVLIVSDMLENSKSLSFYKDGTVYIQSADDALNAVKSNGFLPDFSDAKIYVLGAGFGSRGYKNAATMKNINLFWSKFFEASNSTLIGWGQPELFEEIN